MDETPGRDAGSSEEDRILADLARAEEIQAELATRIVDARAQIVKDAKEAEAEEESERARLELSKEAAAGVKADGPVAKLIRVKLDELEEGERGLIKQLQAVHEQTRAHVRQKNEHIRDLQEAHQAAHHQRHREVKKLEAKHKELHNRMLRTKHVAKAKGDPAGQIAELQEQVDFWKGEAQRWKAKAQASEGGQ